MQFFSGWSVYIQSFGRITGSVVSATRYRRATESLYLAQIQLVKGEEPKTAVPSASLSQLRPGSAASRCPPIPLAPYHTLSVFPGSYSCVGKVSPLVAVCYHLCELPLMRSSGEPTLAWGERTGPSARQMPSSIIAI